MSTVFPLFRLDGQVKADGRGTVEAGVTSPGLTVRELFAVVAMHALISRGGQFAPQLPWEVADQVLGAQLHPPREGGAT